MKKDSLVIEDMFEKLVFIDWVGWEGKLYYEIDFC